MVVGFDAAAIVDLVGQIGRVAANFRGQDDYGQLDAYLALMLLNVDTGLRRSLTLAVLAGAQEAARFGVTMIASYGGQLPVGPALNFARDQLGDSAMRLKLSSTGLSAAWLMSLRAMRTSQPTTLGGWSTATP